MPESGWCGPPAPASGCSTSVFAPPLSNTACRYTRHTHFASGRQRANSWWANRRTTAVLHHQGRSCLSQFFGTAWWGNCPTFCQAALWLTCRAWTYCLDFGLRRARWVPFHLPLSTFSAKQRIVLILILLFFVSLFMLIIYLGLRLKSMAQKPKITLSKKKWGRLKHAYIHI